MILYRKFKDRIERNSFAGTCGWIIGGAKGYVAPPPLKLLGGPATPPPPAPPPPPPPPPPSSYAYERYGITRCFPIRKIHSAWQKNAVLKTSMAQWPNAPNKKLSIHKNNPKVKAVNLIYQINVSCYWWASLDH